MILKVPIQDRKALGLRQGHGSVNHSESKENKEEAEISTPPQRHVLNVLTSSDQDPLGSLLKAPHLPIVPEAEDEPLTRGPLGTFNTQTGTRAQSASAFHSPSTELSPSLQLGSNQRTAAEWKTHRSSCSRAMPCPTLPQQNTPFPLCPCFLPFIALRLGSM